jgi:5-formyltetrahydrofolate cyclo-ligase
MVVPSPSSPARKEQLRAEALARRKALAAALTPDLRIELERKLAERVLPHLIGARVIAGYHPMRDEISPLPILERLGSGQTAALPWFAGRDAQFIFRKGPATEPGPWGVLQPNGASPAVSPDIVLVPLVLADRAGTRIGHGKGHYDRALSHLRAAGPVFTIGIGWEEQLADETLSPDPWDIPLDAIATPREWVTCR